MEIIFQKVLKNKIISFILIYGVDVEELILDFPLSIGSFHTIEYDKVLNEIVLHKFEWDFDYPYLFDDLSNDDKLRVYQILKGIQHLN
jgi:hypothetical protein